MGLTLIVEGAVYTCRGYELEITNGNGKGKLIGCTKTNENGLTTKALLSPQKIESDFVSSDDLGNGEPICRKVGDEWVWYDDLRDRMFKVVKTEIGQCDGCIFRAKTVKPIETFGHLKEGYVSRHSVNKEQSDNQNENHPCDCLDSDMNGGDELNEIINHEIYKGDSWISKETGQRIVVVDKTKPSGQIMIFRNVSTSKHSQITATKFLEQYELVFRGNGPRLFFFVNAPKHIKLTFFKVEAKAPAF